MFQVELHQIYHQALMEKLELSWHTNVQTAAWAQWAQQCKTICSVGTCRHKRKKCFNQMSGERQMVASFWLPPNLQKRTVLQSAHIFPAKKDS